jgi:hypothetical protein
MIAESYTFIVSKDKTQYFFQSEGKQGVIWKIVIFTHIIDDLWNLGFGDIDVNTGQIDGQIVTNNQDVAKVLGTVAEITHTFFADFPERSIEIKPVDERRKRLYNYVFQKHFKDIGVSFYVIGSLNKEEESYSPNNFYDTFKLKLKNY